MADRQALDERTLQMMEQVRRQKTEIAQLEKPRWNTNMTFSYTEGRVADAINLRTITDPAALVKIAAFLVERDRSYRDAAQLLGVAPEREVPLFSWQGYNMAEWMEDLKTRIHQIQIREKKQRLSELEERLNKIVSPELRAQMELEAIQAELGV